MFHRSLWQSFGRWAGRSGQRGPVLASTETPVGGRPHWWCKPPRSPCDIANSGSSRTSRMAWMPHKSRYRRGSFLERSCWCPFSSIPRTGAGSMSAMRSKAAPSWLLKADVPRLRPRGSSACPCNHPAKYLSIYDHSPTACRGPKGRFRSRGSGLLHFGGDGDAGAGLYRRVQSVLPGPQGHAEQMARYRRAQPCRDAGRIGHRSGQLLCGPGIGSR